MKTKKAIDPSYDNSLAMFRWQHGHRVFHSLLSTIITVIDNAIVDIDEKNYESVVQSINRLITLYDSATASMRYTADFPSQIYEDMIRPSMMPPIVRPGFSGLLNTEHKLMIRGLKELNNKINHHFGEDKEKWPKKIYESWHRLQREKIRNRENHGLICSKFVVNGRSLLSEYYQTQKNTQ